MDQELEKLAQTLGEAAGQGNDDVDAIHSAVTEFQSSDENSEEAHESFLARLRHGAERLEATHPDLSTALGRVIDSLTAFGL